jgi:hypothetical protein
MGGKKIMGLPLPVWLGVAAAGLLLGIYLRRKGSSTSSTLLPAPTPVADSGSITGGVSGGGVAPAAPGIDPSTLSELLAGNASLGGSLDSNTAAQGSLIDAIGQLVYNIGSSAGSGSSAQGAQPSNPLSSSTPAKAPAAVAKTAPKAPTKVTYYTYKKNVPLPKGTSLHFTSGKGYYAA